MSGFYWALVGLQKTTQLVTVGLYKYIRHPLYSSLLFLSWGAFFKHPIWLAFGLAMTTTGFLVVTSKIEENENIQFFGSDYEDYRRKTKMFVPFIF
jgi:protein-S-isoprenylcysteine O-methyltransferase Ste14